MGLTKFLFLCILFTTLKSAISMEQESDSQQEIISTSPKKASQINEIIFWGPKDENYAVPALFQ